MAIIPDTTGSIYTGTDLDVFDPSGQCTDRNRDVIGRYGPLADICQMGLRPDRCQ